MPFKKQIYAQIDPKIYALLQQYKEQTGKSMRQILEEALLLLLEDNSKPKKPLRGRELVKELQKYAVKTGKKEDIVSKIDEIVYGN